MISPLQLEVACDSYNLRHKNARPAQRYRCESNPDENVSLARSKQKMQEEKRGKQLKRQPGLHFVSPKTCF